MILIYLLMALVGAAAVAFAVQNPTSVAVSFLVWQTGGMPLSLVILLSALAGIVLASVAGFAQQIRLRLRIRNLEGQVAKLVAASVPPVAPAPSERREGPGVSPPSPPMPPESRFRP